LTKEYFTNTIPATTQRSRQNNEAYEEPTRLGTYLVLLRQYDYEGRTGRGRMYAYGNGHASGGLIFGLQALLNISQHTHSHFWQNNCHTNIGNTFSKAIQIAMNMIHSFLGKTIAIQILEKHFPQQYHLLSIGFTFSGNTLATQISGEQFPEQYTLLYTRFTLSGMTFATQGK